MTPAEVAQMENRAARKHWDGRRARLDLPAIATREKARAVTNAAQIIEVVALKHGLTAADLHRRPDQGRWSHTTPPRREAMYLIKEETGLNNEAIGQIFGMEQSSVASSIRAHKERKGIA